MVKQQEQQREFFTIGYGGRSPTEFVERLQTHGIRLLFDVRLRPDRAHLGSFVKAKSADKGIEKLLADGGIQYHSLIELGNVFRQYNAWRERYQGLLNSAGDLLTADLRKMSRSFCLMCAEKDMNRCHRQLIADYLERSGWRATHL